MVSHGSFTYSQISMTEAEHRLLLLVLAWVLGSIPLAVLAFQKWFKPYQHQPLIPNEEAAPAGAFLEVQLPPALPDRVADGLPVRQWKRVDGWVALVTVAVLGLLMGPLSMDPKATTEFRVTAPLMAVQLGFQLSMVGLLVFYLRGARGFRLVSLFGLNRQRWWQVPLYALGWLVPGMMVVVVVTAVTMPWVLQLLGQEAGSPQMIVKALGKIDDPMTKAVVAATVGLGAPLMEELFFRGFLYGVGKRFTHWSYAALGSSLFFAVVHGNVMSLLPLTMLGLLFVLAYEKTQNLLVPVVMHAVFNLVQISVMFYAPQLARQLENS